MPRFTENQRRHAIGMLQAGLAQNIVARHFGVHRNTIQSLLRRIRQSGNTRGRQRSGRPRVTSHQQDNYIMRVHLRYWFQTSSLTARSIPGLRPISSRTVCNRLCDRHIRPQRPTIRPLLLPRHRAARLTWCRRHFRFRRQDWANILFTDESRFHLDSNDGQSQVYCCVGERYADACVIQRRSLGWGSAMVWVGITECGKTPLVVVAGNWLEYAIGMKLFNAMLFHSSKLRPTTSHSSRTTLDHILRVLYVTTWHRRMSTCYRGQRFHPIFQPLRTSGMKQPVTLAEMGMALIHIPQAFFNTLIRSMHHCCQTCINANGGHTHYWIC